MYEGGCACGRIRFRATGAASDVCWCHCRSCRGATGAPLVAWVTFEKTRFALTAGEPTLHRSSDPVLRGFCPTCGTALTYEHEARPGEIDVTLTSLDDPAALAPTFHIWFSQRLPWVVPGDGLPRHPTWRREGA